MAKIAYALLVILNDVACFLVYNSMITGSIEHFSDFAKINAIVVWVVWLFASTVLTLSLSALLED